MDPAADNPKVLPSIQIAQWVLDKELAWIAAADAKVAVVIAIDTAIFAVIATAFAANRAPTAWAIGMSLTAGVLLAAAFICAAVSLFPRTDGPLRSLIYFGAVAKKSPVDYVAALCSASQDEIYKDIAYQIHRNAEIAQAKHCWVRRSIGCSFLAAFPWAIALLLLVFN